MKSKLSYTQAEANEIIALIKEKLDADTSRQKSIRAKIRNRGFWASDFGFRDGYTVDDFLSVIRIEGNSVSVTKSSISKIPASNLNSSPILQDKSRRKSDECYIIDLCDEVLKQKALRQHRFDFLRGDTGVRLPVDAYYPLLNLVIEFRERQHTEEVKFFDRRQTASGMGRGDQRKLYDERRRKVLPEQGLNLIELGYDLFDHTRNKKLTRTKEKDLEIILHSLKNIRKK